MRTLAFLAGIWVALWGSTALAQTDILLADDSRPPKVAVSWPTGDGKTTEFQGERRYQSPSQRTHLGGNIDCYVALGGTRLNKGLADPRGAVVLVGLYKRDASRPFFDRLADGAEVTITLTAVHMSKPAEAQPKKALMHLKYMQQDLEACGLSGDARNLFNTADAEDPVAKRASEGSVRAGWLDGQGKDHGKVETKVEADGGITVTLRFPYALLRHIKDPYQRTTPGGFFEPNHFHFEIELLPREPSKEPGEKSKEPGTPSAEKPADPAKKP